MKSHTKMDPFLVCRIEALHNDVEIRLKVLNRSVDQQAEQSSALLMTGRAAPEETRVKGGQYKALHCSVTYLALPYHAVRRTSTPTAYMST